MAAEEVVRVRRVEAAAAVFDQRLGVFEIAVDGLDGGADAVFLERGLGFALVDRYWSLDVARGGGEGGGWYLSDLLAEDFGFDDHALAMRCFPQRAGEDADVQFLHADAHA